MATKPSALRIVGDEQPTKRVRKHTVASAASRGTELDLLIAMRDRVAKAVTDECTPRDLAALTKRLSDITHEIKVMRAAQRIDGDQDQGDDAEDDAFDSSAL